MLKPLDRCKIDLSSVREIGYNPTIILYQFIKTTKHYLEASYKDSLFDFQLVRKTGFSQLYNITRCIVEQSPDCRHALYCIRLNDKPFIVMDNDCGLLSSINIYHNEICNVLYANNSRIFIVSIYGSKQIDLCTELHERGYNVRGDELRSLISISNISKFYSYVRNDKSGYPRNIIRENLFRKFKKYIDNKEVENKC